MTTKPMTEAEMRTHLAEALKGIKADDLTATVRDVMAMPHDYGTVCVAIGALAAAAARAADREPNGGITGFQAGAVFWEFVRAWDVFGDGPKRMTQYANMLYPQYAHDFERTISADTWAWLQEHAAKRLAETNGQAHPDVVAHWKQIVAGSVPFGYAVVAGDD